MHDESGSVEYAERSGAQERGLENGIICFMSAASCFPQFRFNQALGYLRSGQGKGKGKSQIF